MAKEKKAGNLFFKGWIPGGTYYSRLTTLNYPDGRVLRYNYAAGLDDSISRPSSLTNSGLTYEQYAYLGLSTVVKRGHVQGATEIGLSYIKQTGESNGDAGDPYTGLDRFGRVVDQRWLKSDDPNNPLDRFSRSQTPVWERAPGRNGVSLWGVPKQEFGNEGKPDQHRGLRLTSSTRKSSLHTLPVLFPGNSSERRPRHVLCPLSSVLTGRKTMSKPLMC